MRGLVFSLWYFLLLSRPIFLYNSSRLVTIVAGEVVELFVYYSM